MARVENPFGITGTFGSVTIYKMYGRYYMRTKGYLDPERMKKDPKLFRVRESQQEFSAATKAAKLFRQGMNSALSYFADPLMFPRLTQHMLKIIQQDKSHPRGSRMADEGLNNPEGKAVMKSFDINKGALLSSVLRCQWKVDNAKGVISLPEFTPSKSLAYPKDATHFRIGGAFGIFNFTKKTYDIKITNDINSAILSRVMPVCLYPSSMPKGCGPSFYFMKVEFFTMVKNEQCPVGNGKYNALSVIDVI